MSLLPADSYTVVNKTILNENDRKILIMLYQGIVGSDPVNLYFSLWTELEKDEVLSEPHTHSFLSKSLGKTLDTIESSREKLEAIGLLKTYLKKDSINEYIYELYSPLGAEDFFDHPILNISLYNNLGKSEYEKIVEYFKMPKINKKEYVDITKKFSDVFESVNKHYDINGTNNIKKINRNKIIISNEFDFNILEASLEKILSKKNIDSIKELILNLSYIYNLDEHEMAKLLRNSLNSNGVVSKIELRKNARNYYQFENEDKLPKLVHRKQPEYLKTPAGDMSNRAKMIYTFETISPYTLLKAKSDGAKPTNRDLRLVETLLMDLKLKPGVVNVLIDYVLKINDNKLTKNFVETIAAQWKRSKIETVPEAMELAEKEHKKYSTKPTKTETKKPIWFDKDIKEEKASKEEIEEIEQMLNNI